MDKPQIFGFDFQGAAVGAFAPIGWGLFREGGIFACFPKPGDTVLSCGSAKSADMGVDSPLSGNMGSSFIFPIGNPSVSTFTGESVSPDETALGDKAKGW